MKNKTSILFFLLALIPGLPNLLHAQGSAFTYQGRLTDNGNPASGTYDLRLRLASDQLGNNYVGGTLLKNGIPVTNGLFTVILDFGAAPINGSNLWLQVDVRTNGIGSYTTLTPLQALTPTPYAIMAATASNLSGTLSAGQLTGALPSAQLSGTYGGAVTFNNAASSFSGAFIGNGAGLSNLNAATLGGFGSSAFWQAAGNGGTAAGVNFLGTTDNQPLELKVNGGRALRLEPNTNGAPNVIGGSPRNFAATGIVGGTIGGGGGVNFGGQSFTNKVSSSFATIGGGADNAASGNFATIGGGNVNVTSEVDATVAGGAVNTASGFGATVGGGIVNTSSGSRATVGGGDGNTSSGVFASVSGGQNNVSSGVYATIGGGEANAGSGYAATVGGGSQNTSTNECSTVGGGLRNTSGANYTTVGGGSRNIANGIGAVVGGGGYDGPVSFGNSANGACSFIGGGIANTTAGFESAVAGGRDNHATNNYASIPGGFFNTAGGQFSFAAGRQARALHDGTFVWGDSTGADFASTATNQFLIRASGGVGIGTASPSAQLEVASAGNTTIRISGPGGPAAAVACEFATYNPGLNSPAARILATDDGNWSDHLDLMTKVPGASGNALQSRLHIASSGSVGIGTLLPVSALQVIGTVTATAFNPPSDRNLKENFAPVSGREVLEKVAALPISRWNFKGDTATPHVGPMAQDFHAAFRLGTDERHIATVDADGVALAAIQGLNQKLMEELKRRDAENAELRTRLEAVERSINASR